MARFVLPERGDAASGSLCLPGHAHRVGTSSTKLGKAARWTGGGQEEERVLPTERTFSEQHQQLPVMRNATQGAGLLLEPRCGWEAEGEGVHGGRRVPAKQAAHLPPTEHAASFGEGHRANSMTAEADDLTAETLEMGVRRRGLSSSCICGLLRNLWQGVSPLCFPSHSSYVSSVYSR